MKQSEAKQQLEAFFRKLGKQASFFDEKNFAQARIGEAFIGFEYGEADGVLSAQALIYRFRKPPRDEILDAVLAEETDANAGGGRIVFAGESLSLYLQKDFAEIVVDKQFYEQINRLARASLEWSGEILARVAEKANG